jgi:catechol 2,3-dioxygenase-like lactoylglutathione lyase family enzyme
MLRDALACATVPTTDLERSARFYEETLGLTGARLGLEEGGLYYEGGGGTMLHIYETKATAGRHAVAVFLVDDLDGVMAGLERRGVVFDDYDDEDDGGGDGSRGAWFRDPDGNVVALRSY